MNEWEAKYKALLVGIENKEIINNAEKLVDTALRMYSASPLPFDTIFYSLLSGIQALQKPLDLSVFEPRLSIFFAWYDLWIGFYYDRKKKDLYFCPLPCVVIKVRLKNAFT